MHTIEDQEEINQLFRQVEVRVLRGASLRPAHITQLKSRVNALIEKAYKNGWNDRESDLIVGIDRVYGQVAPKEDQEER